MKIKNLQLKNFKRFTDLTLQDIPDNAKLVLLLGSNGSGKSSVFDAFEKYSTQFSQYSNYLHVDKNYYSKDTSRDFIISINNYGDGKISKISFYGRSSFRQIPKLTRTGLGNSNFDVVDNSDRPSSFIERDLRFENDLEHIFGKLLKEFFRTTDDKSEIKKTIIDPILSLNF
jgi:AAA15 family ATPase/GTPase